jgi:hypothetical protein
MHAVPEFVQVRFPAFEVTVYAVTSEPPLSGDAVHVTTARAPAIAAALMVFGGKGAVTGIWTYCLIHGTAVVTRV